MDDEPDIQTIARIALETQGGFSVTSCSCGSDALAAVEAGFTPDLILLDVIMPGMDGPSTKQAFHKRPQLAKTPVIFLTAKTQSMEKAYYISLGAIGVITKPFDPMELAAQVNAFWLAHGKQ